MVLSPGTALSGRYLEEDENNFLCAVVLENQKCGVAVLDHSTGEFQTCSRNQSDLLSLIKQFNVSEIIISEDQEIDLRSILHGEMIFTTKIPDWCRTFEAAYETLTSFFNVSTLKGYGIENDQLALVRLV